MRSTRAEPDEPDVMGRPTTIRHAPTTPPLDMVPGVAPLFSGRRHELDALDGVLDQVTADGARVVLVEGPAGVGKTAVLRRFVERHRDLRVFWWSG